MLKMITLKIDDSILMRVRQLAVDENKSVSAWVSDLIERTLLEVDDYGQVRREGDRHEVPSVSIQVLQEMHVNLIRKGVSVDESAGTVRRYLSWRITDKAILTSR